MSMRKSIKVSLIQFEPKALDANGNGRRMGEHAEREAAAGADLIVFPELSNTGYIEPVAAGLPILEGRLDTAAYARELHAAATTLEGALIEKLRAIADRFSTHIVAGLALRSAERPGLLHNTSVLLGPDGLVGVYEKVHLWHCEKLYFAAGRRIDAFETSFGKLGMQVCYDIRFPELTRILSLKGATVITSVWASPYPEGAPPKDPDIFKHRAYTRAIENGVFFLSCNRVGRQGDHRFLGRSLVVAPNGAFLAASDHDEEDVIRAELDPKLIEEYRTSAPIWIDRQQQIYDEAQRSAEER
jgi:omega-amidase